MVGRRVLLIVAVVALGSPFLALSTELELRFRLTESGETVGDDDEDDDKPVELLGEECEASSVEAVDGILKDSLSSIIGMEKVKSQMEELVTTLRAQALQKGTAGETGYFDPAAKARKPKQAFSFLGPPGTGKTTVAQILGKIFCALGLVKRTGFLEVRPDQLMGQYSGQTAGKTRKTLAPGLGGVVFIDEAYLISAGDGKPNQFQQECVAALMAVMDAHAKDTVFVFAGYKKEMEHFFKTNAGLKRRVPNIFRFDPMSLDDLMKILDLKLRKSQVAIIPDLTSKSIGYLVKQFTEWGRISFQGSDNADAIWHRVGGKPRTAREVPFKFLRYARVALAYIFKEHGDVDDNLVQEFHAKYFNSGEIHLKSSTLVDAKPHMMEFLNAKVRPLLEDLPEEMRVKSNGGLIDTMLQGAYAARADRILNDGLISETQCADTQYVSTLRGKLMFSATCPTLSFFTLSDLIESQKVAKAAWEGGDEAGECADQKAKEDTKKSPDEIKDYLSRVVAYLALDASALARSTSGLFSLQLQIPVEHEILPALRSDSVREGARQHPGRMEFLRCRALVTWISEQADFDLEHTEVLTNFLHEIGDDPTLCNLRLSHPSGEHPVRAELMMHAGHAVARESIKAYFESQPGCTAILGTPPDSGMESKVITALHMLHKAKGRS